MPPNYPDGFPVELLRQLAQLDQIMGNSTSKTPSSFHERETELSFPNFSTHKLPTKNKLYKTLCALTTVLLRLSGSLEIIKRLLDPFRHTLLTLPDPHSRVKVLLIGFIFSIGVPHLGRNIILLLEHIVSYPRTVSVLQVGVKIDFDDAIANGFVVFVFTTATATVEDKEPK